MRYVFAIIVPPLALLLCGKLLQAVLNLIFWVLSIPLIFFFGFGLFIWLLCTVHAFVVCGRCDADKRLNRLTQAIEGRHGASESAKA